MKYKIIPFSLTLIISLISLITITNAQNMNSPRYKIQFGNINIGSGKKQSTNYNLTTTLGQTAAQEFQSSGYILKAGFQYIYTLYPFSFSLSKTQVNFGSLIPESPVTDQITLTVSFPGAGDYQVTVVEKGPLKQLNSSYYIPDTICDGGTNTCSETIAKPWTLNTAYGFGYNMSGQDIPSDFIDNTYFRPFADELAGEPPAVVMTSSNVGKNKQATMTLKVNISSTQAGGNYQTVLLFTATPSF